MSLFLGNKVADMFHDHFGGNSIVIKSPGRINLIGEHVDYNDGFVLPAAIDKAVYIAMGKKNSNGIRLYSDEYKQHIEVKLSEVRPSKSHPWTNYILGVVDQLKKRGYPIGGFDLVITGDIPLGAGLSSSAAVECATAFGVNELFGLNLHKLDLVKLSQQAEHEFAGVKCGIMDQFASMFGKAGHAIRLDCRSLEYEYIPLTFDGLSFVLFDTQVKHALASTAYNRRREECDEAIALIKRANPQIQSLRDCTLQMVDNALSYEDPILYKRAQFVLCEIDRVVQGCHDLEKKDSKSFGQKMFLSHEGLKVQYEVSCAELDFLIDQVKENQAVIGARMMGGGFGGCTINLVEKPAVDNIVSRLQQAYWNEFKLELKAYPVSVENGTDVVSN